MGLNVNLAPVLDVYDAAGNFIDEFGRAQNTDTGPVTLNVPLSQLRARDEAPYPPRSPPA